MTTYRIVQDHPLCTDPYVLMRRQYPWQDWTVEASATNTADLIALVRAARQPQGPYVVWREPNWWVRFKRWMSEHA